MNHNLPQMKQQGILGSRLSAISFEMQKILGTDDELNATSLCDELAFAEQREILRLIVSAFRENLIPEASHRYFVLRAENVEIKARDASSAVRLRSPEVPNKLVQIFSVNEHQETELIGIDGALQALRPFLEKCQAVPNEAAWERLIHASQQSILNEAMAQAYKKVWNKRFNIAIGEFNTIFDYLEQNNVSTYHTFNQLAAFDARVISPFSKMKLDLTVREVLEYSPEFSQDVAIHFAALHKTKARTSVADQYPTFLSGFSELFPSVYPRWCDSLQLLQLEPDNYLPIPLHPLNEIWAKEHLLPILDNGDLIFLPDVKAKSVPSLSFRSMLLDTQCLKLPAPLQTTHLIRNIDIPEICLGPLFSDLLHKIIEDEGLGNNLVIERDLLGAYLDFEKVGCSSDIASMFGFISRQHPDTQIQRGEHVIPVAGLFVIPPGKNRQFFFNILNKRGIFDPEAQYDYFTDYIRLVVGTQLTLYFKTGLMLEAHQQNLNLVFDKDWILKRLMYHDIPGGVSAYTPLLKVRHEIPEILTSGIFYFRDTPERSIFQFIHPTLTAHIGPLIQAMARQLKLDRLRLRKIVRAEIELGIQMGRNVPAKSTREAQLRSVMIDKFEEIVLGSKTLPGKMMLGRLYLQSLNKDWGRKVPNPELLSSRVLIPPSDIHNFLTAEDNP